MNVDPEALSATAHADPRRGPALGDQALAAAGRALAGGGARLLRGAAAPPHGRHGGARVRARHRLRRAAYVGVPRAVVEQMMQQEAMRVRLHGQPAVSYTHLTLPTNSLV